MLIIIIITKQRNRTAYGARNYMGNEASLAYIYTIMGISSTAFCRKDAHAVKTAQQKIIKADNIHLNGVYCLFSIFSYTAARLRLCSSDADL